MDKFITFRKCVFPLRRLAGTFSQSNEWCIRLLLLFCCLGTSFFVHFAFIFPQWIIYQYILLAMSQCVDRRRDLGIGWTLQPREIHIHKFLFAWLLITIHPHRLLSPSLSTCCHLMSPLVNCLVPAAAAAALNRKNDMHFFRCGCNCSFLQNGEISTTTRGDSTKVRSHCACEILQLTSSADHPLILSRIVNKCLLQVGDWWMAHK